MAVSGKWYTNGAKNLSNGTTSWLSDTIKVMLTTASYTPNQDTHEFKSSVSNEVTGTGYSAGGITLGSKTIASDATTNETRYDAADISWTSATFTARYAVIYEDTGSAATSALLGWVDFGADVPVSSGTFSITWDSTGVLKITAS